MRFKGKRWFPISEGKLATAQVHFNRFGVWSLLLAWLPVVGDPLTFVAGVLRVRFLLFLVLVTFGKALRYGVVVFLLFEI